MPVLPRIYSFFERRRLPVLFAFGVVIVFSLVLGARLHLDNDMLNLLPDDVPAVKTVRKLKAWNERFAATMYLGVVRDDATTVDKLKDFSEQLGEELRKSRWIEPGLTVAMDVSRIQQALPLFLDPDDLRLVGEQLDRAVKAQRKKGSGFYLQLDEQEGDKPEDLLRPLLPKYAARFQTSALGAPTAGTPQDHGEAKPSANDPDPNAALARLRLKLDRSGTHLYYISDDGKMLVFTFHPTFPPFQLAHYPDLVRDIEGAIARAHQQVPGSEGVTVYKGGTYPLQWDQRETTLRDALHASVISGILIVFVVMMTIRGVRLVFLVVSCLVVGLVICGGLSFLAVGSINVITVFLLAVLAGLGIDFGLFLTTRYSLFRSSGLGTVDATREAWTQTAIPAFMGAITTMSVMVVLAFGKFRGFAHLGVICAIGIVTIYVAMYGLLPLLLLTFRPAAGTPGITIEGARVWVSDRLHAAAGPIARFVLKGRRDRAILIVAGIVTVVAILGIPRLRFAYTGEELTVKDQQSLAIDRLILEHYGENVDQTVVLADNEKRARRIHQYFQENFGRFKSIARYESMFTYLPPRDTQIAALAEIGPLQKAISRLPGKSDDAGAQFGLDLAKKVANPQPIGFSDMPDLLNTMYLATDRTGQVVGHMGAIYANGWLWDFDQLKRFVDEIEAIRVDGQPLEITGRPQIFLNVINIVRHEAAVFSGVGALLIFVMFWIQARKLRFALLSILPLLLGVPWLLGLMPILGRGGLALNFVNVIAFPILTGLAVSYGVHVVYNYRIYGAADKALQVVARPILGSAITATIGWGSLLLATMNGMRSIGWVSVLGMTSIALCSLIVLPALIATLDRRGWITADRMPPV